MYKGFLIPALLLLVLPLTAGAQSGSGVDVSSGMSAADDGQEMSNMPADMRIKMAIERAEIEHRKILDSANELGDLTDEVVKRFNNQGALSADDVKKLGTIEKLAKRILSDAAGGEVSDKSLDTDHVSLKDAIDRLSAAAGAVKKNIISGSRYIVSASLIEGSNEVINLVQYIRRSFKSN